MKKLIAFKSKEIGEGYINYYDVTFLGQFGPWEWGEKIDCLCIDFQTFKLVEWTDEGDVKRECKFEIAIND